MKDWTDEWDVQKRDLVKFLKQFIFPAAIVFAFFVVAWLACQGCTPVHISKPIITPQEIKIKVDGGTIEKSTETKISKSMEVINPDLQFSMFTKIYEGTAYIALTSVHSWAAESMWSDFKLLRMKSIKRVIMYLNNPGGSAFDGFGITDSIRLLKNDGIEVIGEASGLLASAAIPVFLSCNKRIASKHTLFLIHPSAVNKFFAREEERDIESQAEMFRLSREKYTEIIKSHSKLSTEEITAMLKRDSWFDAEKALAWGMVDEIK